jgi:hypothetical protein
MVPLLFLWLGVCVSYTMKEIENDSKTLPYEALMRYRGPILGDIWYDSIATASSASASESETKTISKQQYQKEQQMCKKLYYKTLEKVQIPWPPPKTPPADLHDAYTMGGRTEEGVHYIAEKQNGGTGYQWNKKVFDLWRNKQIGCGLYSDKHCDPLVAKHASSYIHNHTALVVGSQNPWAEASLFNHGASHVTTIEYMKISSDYPNYVTLHPTEAAEIYLNHSWKLVDVAFSFSSLEHDGLGRYGDALNPYGDLESLARLRCLLRPGGILFLGLPVAVDTMVWNAHRIYGRYRLGLVMMGWKLLDLTPDSCSLAPHPDVRTSWRCQPLMVLQKPHLKKSNP